MSAEAPKPQSTPQGEEAVAACRVATEPSNATRQAAESTQPKANPSSSRGGKKARVGSKSLVALALVVIAVVAFGVWYFAIRTKDDRSRFQGQWQMAVPATDRDPRGPEEGRGLAFDLEVPQEGFAGGGDRAAARRVLRGDEVGHVEEVGRAVAPVVHERLLQRRL